MKRKIIYLPLYFFALFILVLIFIIFFKQFQIKKVIIIAPKKVLVGLHILNSQNLLFINTKKTAQYLSDRNIEIKTVKLIKTFPQTLIIDLIYREPKAVVLSKNQKLYIDEDGIILSDDIFPGLSLASIDASEIDVIVKKKGDWRVVKAFAILENLKQLSITIDQISIDNKNAVFHAMLPEGTEIIIPQTCNPSFIAASLQIIVSRFRIEGKMVTRIDFRYDKPIVVLTSGEKISSH